MRRFLLLLALLVAACSGGKGDPCVTSNDCFHGEVCRSDGYCGEPITTIDDNNANDANSSADAGNNADPDGGGTNADPNNVSNNVDPDLGTVDVGRDDGVVVGGNCIVDPFDVCEDDEDPSNNSFPGAHFTPTTRGCQPSGFVPLDMTLSGRQCALDPEDQFYVTVVECDADEPGMIIEATLDVKQDCDPSLIWFDVEQIGTSCAEPNPDSDKTLRCETLATGERRISVIWPGSSVPSVGSIRYSIQTPDRQDVQFDYDLRIVVREP